MASIKAAPALTKKPKKAKFKTQRQLYNLGIIVAFLTTLGREWETSYDATKNIFDLVYKIACKSLQQKKGATLFIFSSQCVLLVIAGKEAEFTR